MAVMKAYDMAPVACAAMVASALCRNRQHLFMNRNVRWYTDGGQLVTRPNVTRGPWSVSSPDLATGTDLGLIN
ncbi:hypothetical protein BOTNAR_0022g00190 [Botryotinia narcissicola]|uniref:Uncharacterized protein n=1 Tax=Botryotinia narcissicola TaxID=278944 RepID=A0A4Z1J4R9_9HELO|nr:hypothetical protein BOTNAR_0022g00190 [Botryotinia narcissicola]